MELTIPDDLIEKQLLEQLIPVILIQVDKRLDLITKSHDLPEYPNKSEVKTALKIGDTKLSEWLDKGLKIQQWSERDFRIERSELKKFLKTMEIGDL